MNVIPNKPFVKSKKQSNKTISSNKTENRPCFDSHFLSINENINRIISRVSDVNSSLSKKVLNEQSNYSQSQLQKEYFSQINEKVNSMKAMIRKESFWRKERKSHEEKEKISGFCQTDRENDKKEEGECIIYSNYEENIEDNIDKLNKKSKKSKKSKQNNLKNQVTTPIQMTINTNNQTPKEKEHKNKKRFSNSNLQVTETIKNQYNPSKSFKFRTIQNFDLEINSNQQNKRKSNKAIQVDKVIKPKKPTENEKNLKKVRSEVVITKNSSISKGITRLFNSNLNIFYIKNEIFPNENNQSLHIISKKSTFSDFIERNSGKLEICHQNDCNFLIPLTKTEGFPIKTSKNMKNNIKLSININNDYNTCTFNINNTINSERINRNLLYFQYKMTDLRLFNINNEEYEANEAYNSINNVNNINKDHENYENQSKNLKFLIKNTVSTKKNSVFKIKLGNDKEDYCKVTYKKNDSYNNHENDDYDTYDDTNDMNILDFSPVNIKNYSLIKSSSPMNSNSVFI